MMHLPPVASKSDENTSRIETSGFEIAKNPDALFRETYEPRKRVKQIP